MAVPFDPAAVADATDTVVKTTGGGVLGVLAYKAFQWAMDKFGSGPGSVRALASEEEDVRKLQVEVERITKELGEIRTAQALAARDADTNKDRMSKLEGGFSALSNTVQLTMNDVQTSLADIRGYMRRESEQRHDRRWEDPTPPPRYVRPSTPLPDPEDIGGPRR